MTGRGLPGPVDLEERARAFLAALGSSSAAAPFLSDRLSAEVGPRTLDKEGFLRWLAAGGLRGAVLRDLAVKRNVAFAWTSAGVLVLSWDQDGRVAYLALRA